MDAQLLAVLKKIEQDDLAIIAQGLVPAVAAEVQDLSKGNATVSAVEAVAFPALVPLIQQGLASLLAKIPGNS